MSSGGHNVYLPLPNTVTDVVTTYESREQFLIQYLERSLPSTDTKDVLEEMKRTFIFDKHKISSGDKNSKKGNKTRCLKRKNIRPKISGSKHGLKYSDLVPLNEMWMEYVRQIFKVKDFNSLPNSPTKPRWDNVNERLLRADYHGAAVTVVRSKCPSVIGISGIVLLETKNCFTVLTEKNQLKTLPKNSSLFKLHLPGASLDVLGSEIQHKPAERSVRKFKSSHFCDL